MTDPEFRSGFIALAGRPNVGKSTLINALAEARVSIVSDKPQTTRRRILGIRTTAECQYVFVDVPGMGGKTGNALGRHMQRAAAQAAMDADVALMVVEAGRWGDGDEHVLRHCERGDRPLALAVNKLDTLRSHAELLPFLDAVQRRASFSCIVPVSARTGENLDRLLALLAGLLPPSEKLFPDGQVTDQTEAVQAAECVREKLMEVLAQELPYSVAVEVEEYAVRDGILHVHAVIWVEREGQKAIVIGRGGSLLKRIGRAARLELEGRLQRKLFLRLWVKVRREWSDDERALRALGLDGT